MRTCVVIMAGGRGERLWPKSTHKRPKQFLRISGERTLLQQTLDRSLHIAEVEDVYVVTSREYSGTVKEQLPELPPENIIVEPISMGTCATVGYSAFFLKERISETIMVVLPSDHVVSDNRKFAEAIYTAVHGAVVHDGLITLGIKPTRPETAYGYVECGEECCPGATGRSAVASIVAAAGDGTSEGHIDDGRWKPDVKTRPRIDDNHLLTRVVRFTEKPSLDVATEFIQTGKYLWNAGIFVWKTSDIIDAIARFAPEFERALGDIRELGLQSASTIAREMIDETDHSNWIEAATEIYRAYGVAGPKSIDYAVMEKADNVFVVPVDFGWDDAGSWTAMERIRRRDGCGNAIWGPALPLESHGNIIENHSQDKVIVTCGVCNLVIVNADDVILIMDKSQSHNIQKIRKAAMDIDGDKADN